MPTSTHTQPRISTVSRRLPAAVLALGLAGLLAACGRQDLGVEVGSANTAPAPAAAPAPQSPEQAAQDAAITAEIRAKFAADSSLAPLAIQVRTRDRLVELQGRAPDAQLRDHATRIAATAKKVLSVDNHMALPQG